MSNIKLSYWIPFLGIGFVWNDPDSSLNMREERTLMIYHGLVTAILIAIGMALLIRMHQVGI